MDYIGRALQKRLADEFGGRRPTGVILAGIVGCGKTTLVRESLRQLSGAYDVFTFTGDDISFRNAVGQDTRHLHAAVRSQTQRRALVFVDEVQKSENIFDALKFAFDESGISFVVSGSNPDYLSTQARKRLQRRASFFTLHPFSLPELLSHAGFIPPEVIPVFQELLFAESLQKARRLASLDLKLRREVVSLVRSYLAFGGLPLAFLAEDRERKLIEIQKVVERGFESLSVGNEAVADAIRIELANLHSQEFTYQNIFQKTGLRQRDKINAVIDELMNQGYLLKKKPFLFDDARKSYLSVFSYIDPGIVTYLTGREGDEASHGRRIEGIVHAELDSLAKNRIPLKSSLSYFKPYTVDANGKVKYKPGEIDFIFSCGSRLVPLEVKGTASPSRADVRRLAVFVEEHRLPFGIALYDGVPFVDSQTKVIWWPFWLV